MIEQESEERRLGFEGPFQKEVADPRWARGRGVESVVEGITYLILMDILERASWKLAFNKWMGWFIIAKGNIKDPILEALTHNARVMR